MVLFNYGSKEITAKVVFYGPGLGGKTTNLQHIHEKMNPETRGKLLSLATESDRTLFFDFLPVNLGMVRGFTVRFQLYTVPGQVYYNATRRLVLKGADAVVFVADSQSEMMEKNLESYENMKENLLANGLDPESIPLVIQYNKRDLANILPVEELDRRINVRQVPHNTAVAVSGEGVLQTFKLITRELMQSLRKKHDIKELQQVESEASVPGAGDRDLSDSGPSAAPEMYRNAVVEEVPGRSTGPGAALGGSHSLGDAVQEIQRQIRKMEEQLQALLAKDENIQDLLQQIKEKLDGEDRVEEVLTAEEIEDPIILKEKKRKKRGFFWNR